jgi:hypothetical protein
MPDESSREGSSRYISIAWPKSRRHSVIENACVVLIPKVHLTCLRVHSVEITDKYHFNTVLEDK